MWIKLVMANPIRLSRVLGIDPGLNITGYGLIDFSGTAPRIGEAGVIRSTARQSLPVRVREICAGVREVLAQWKPEALALEQLYTHYDRPTTAILMGHARGVICLAAAECDTPVFNYNATQIKRVLTGSGRAGKEQVQQAVKRELKLQSLPKPPDVADALAVALCHYYLSKIHARIS